MNNNTLEETSKLTRKSLVRFIALLIFITLTTNDTQAQTAQKNCDDGFSSSWKFDQKNEKISIESFNKQKVCNFIKNQKNSNIEIIIHSLNEKSFSSKVFWSSHQHHDLLKEDKTMEPVKQRNSDYKIFKFPVNLEGGERYTVKNIKTGKILGEGEIK